MVCVSKLQKSFIPVSSILFCAAVAFLSAIIFEADLHADEVGLSDCGKPVIVRGEINHSKRSQQREVADATEQGMYDEEIYGKNFSVLVEGLPEGEYVFEIYLAETYHSGPDARVFSIYYGNDPIAKDLDIFGEAGAYKELKLEAKVYHQEDTINGPLAIRFDAKNDNAKFNAVSVLTAGGDSIACVKAKDLQMMVDARASEIPVVNKPVIYTDTSLPVDRRVADLIRRMSLQEKVGQLVNSAEEISRLGVPAYDYWNECLHGVARAGTATVFPQAIGMAAMWDTDKLGEVADVIATEARAKNNEARAKNPNTARYFGLTFWTPNINIFRDPRWGRGHETYGEDPYLSGKLAVSFIKGLQGGDSKYYKALACAKHFAVHSGPEKLRHTFDAVVSKRDLYETYLPQFEMAVREGKVGNVMSVYNAVYGVPGPANKMLLTDILRDTWGFDGHVVSDCGAVNDVWRNHKYVKTAEEASAVSILAGNDLNCGGTYAALTNAVLNGLLTEADLDIALTRVLTARFKLGLFDTPKECAYLRISKSEYDTPEHSKLSLEAARKSIVLLKNEDVLPLNKKHLRRIAVIGPNASEVVVLHANYNGKATNPISILEGIRREVGDDAVIDYAKGCPISMFEGEPYSMDSSDAKKAIELAKNADFTIFVGGLNANLEGEEMNHRKPIVGFDRGDRTLIELPKPQSDLLKELAGTGTPVIFVNLSGSSVAMPWEAENLSAILQAWYPGQNGGTAVADVLFGKYNPAGRLPVTFYRSTKDLPDFVDYSMKNRTYRYFKGDPLFAFGHGLSYTTFDYSEIKVSSKSVKADGGVKVSVRVENTGKLDGEEVVQLYLRHIDSPVAQPVHSLAGFKRIAIAAGAAKEVAFDLPGSALRYWDTDKVSYVVPSGKFEIQVGGSSDDIRQKIVCEIAK